jgi:hypothetical protein
MPRNSETISKAFSELESPLTLEREERSRIPENSAFRRQTQRHNSGSVPPDGLKRSDHGIDSDIQDQIRHRAYWIYVERGRQDGNEMGDWLDAELEILANR